MQNKDWAYYRLALAQSQPGMQVLLTEDTQRERAAKLAALEEGEMLMETPLPASSTPLASLHQQQSRPAWPQKSPAMSTGACLSSTFLQDVALQPPA